jgi:hypothetical protein
LTIDDDATRRLQTGRLGERNARPQAHGRQHHVTGDALSTGQFDFDTLAFGVDRLRGGAEMKTHSCLCQRLVHQRAGNRRQQPPQRLRTRIDDIHLKAAGDQIVGKFATDQAGAKNRHTPRACQTLSKLRVVLQVVDRQHLIRRIALQRQADRVRAQRQHQPLISNRTAAGLNG